MGQARRRVEAPAEREPERPPERRRSKRRELFSRTGVRITAGVLALVVLVVVLSFFVDEPLRRSIESGMNRSLKGYQVTLPHAHFSLFGLSVELTNLTVRQQAHPEPAVAVFPRLRASVQWLALLRLRLVADVLFDRPKVYVNLAQLTQEESEKIPVKDRGWQQALETIYPLKINLLRIENGEITYLDVDESMPLRLTGVYASANNIRNIHSREHVYPSPIRARATLFETGRVSLDGHADFMAEPYAGFHFVFDMRKVPFERLKSVAARTQLAIRGGVLDASGEIEYSPKTQRTHLKELTITGLSADSVHTPATAPKEAARKETVQKAAREVANAPQTLIQVDKIRLNRCEFGWINKARDPGYRVFLSPVDVTVTNFSNHFEKGPARAKLAGKFMGSGSATAEAAFRPEAKGADFDLKVAIEQTDLKTMNDLFRSYGKFDVAAGSFSFYTELHVKNGQVTGYVKPLFENMKVADSRQEADRNIFHKLYVKLVGGVAALLTNPKTEKVATQATIEGPVGGTKTSTWQVIGKLIENAFIRAILPGFDESIGPRARKGTPS